MRGKPKKLTGFRALYYHYVYLLRKYQRPTAPPRRSRYMMDELIKLGRYQEQFKLLVKYKIDTVEQLTTLERAIQAEIDALTDQRKSLHRQRRKDPENETLFSEIRSINQSIRTRRHELRLCARIEADSPTVRQKIKEQPPKTTTPTRRRKRGYER